MEDEFRDQTIVCRVCLSKFTWTAGEQRYFKARLLKPPRVCPPCRPSTRREVTRG